jgi:hypothetical protein
LLRRHHDCELEISLYSPYRFLIGDYPVFGCGSMAFGTVNLKSLLRVCSSLRVEPHPHSAFRRLGIRIEDLMSEKNKIKIMTDTNSPSIALHTRTRRQAIVGAALTLLSLSRGSMLWGSTQQSSMKEAPPTGANQKRTSLHQEIDFKTSPQRIYEALLDAKQFAALTTMSAEIDPKAGGAFSTFGGLIVGRNVELILNQRIVQAWRPTHWDSGIYSIAKFELKPRAAEATIILDHTGFPEGEYDSLNSGWKARYWDPLKKFLA